MYLYQATDDYKINGISYPGLPILINKTGEVVREAHAFFVDYCIRRGRVESVNSWDKYGRDLYDYLSFCEANDLDWKEVGEDQDSMLLASYRDWALSQEVGNKPNTVNGRLRTAIKFYQFALKHGHVASLPYGIENVTVRRPKQFLAHTDATGGKKGKADVTVKTRRTKIRVLSTSQAADLVNGINNPTHKLIVRLALTSGLRREELATFPVKYVIDPSTYTKHKTFIRVQCLPEDMKLKGNQERGIDIPRSVMGSLWRYVLTVRHELEQVAGAAQATLFLTAHGLPYSRSGSTLLQIIKDAGNTASLPFVNVHILRHTYATHTLYSMRRRKSVIDPLLYVRDRLGHASVATTEKYLHVLSDVEDAISNSYQEEIDRLTREAAHG